jgi:RES domain-containing protein
MELYRIAHKLYADLEGIGGISYSGRWHNAGQRVVYLSERASLCAWEKFVQYESVDKIPLELVLMTIFVSKPSIIEIPETKLIKGWNNFPHFKQTMDYGSDFLKDNNCLLLKVPSAVIPSEYNYILNPKHPQFVKCKITNIVPFKFDKRIKNNR